LQIRYAKIALKTLKSYDTPTRKRIIDSITMLTEMPPKGDIKALHNSQNERRLRVGKFRIVYEYITENKIKILQINRIDSRGDIYK